MMWVPETATKTRKHEILLVQGVFRGFVLSWLIVLASCSPRDASPPASAAGPSTSTIQATTPPKSTAPRIVILGDSLTAGLGLPVGAAYPSLLQKRVDGDGLGYEVVNAGVSGDTSAGGLSRVDWSLEGDVRVLVVALGGNDALRGLPPAELQHNLAQIIERAQARKISVVLAGMESPPNWGRDYNVSFHKVFTELADTYHLPLVPFLLQGVAGSETLNQADGIHPTAEGARMVAENVWSVLKPVLDEQRRNGQSSSP
jgi:acyl-CoA thioesterase-1